MTRNDIIGSVHDTCLKNPGKIRIEGIGTFEFHPREVKTVREDIFRPGHFSVFAVLARLAERGDLDLERHFDEAMNTNVVDSINGEEGWWYHGCYDRGRGQEALFQGCREVNLFRMDHFPYKDNMAIVVYRMSQADVETRYRAFRAEAARKRSNGGRVVVPTVRIHGQKEELAFHDVEVKPHNLRKDLFQEGVVTAVDIIMSLGDEGRLTYDLTWCDKLGEAEIKSFYLTRINGDEAYGRCGFVYETGALPEFRGFRGNRIHIHPDIRVLNAPGFAEFSWVCLGRGGRERRRKFELFPESRPRDT